MRMRNEPLSPTLARHMPLTTQPVTRPSQTYQCSTNVAGACWYLVFQTHDFICLLLKIQFMLLRIQKPAAGVFLICFITLINFAVDAKITLLITFKTSASSFEELISFFYF